MSELFIIILISSQITYNMFFCTYESSNFIEHSHQRLFEKGIYIHVFNIRVFDVFLHV